MGFPVLTVTETKEGIVVRQDRFLETGHAKPEDNQTIWYAAPILKSRVADLTVHAGQYL